MRVFFDVNVLMDVLFEREPHATDSVRAWSLAESKQVEASVSVMSLPLAFYLMRRAKGANAAWAGVRLIRDVFNLVPTDEQIIHQALDGSMADFEDAIQFCSALRARASILITRNQKHFPTREIAVLTPSQFLDAHFRDSTGGTIASE